MSSVKTMTPVDPQREALELRREVDALERRLHELRARLSPWEPLRGSLDLVECQAGSDRIALPLRSIERVVPVAALAPIPEAPPWVPGLLRLAGATIPVIDVSARLRRAARAVELSDLIVVCVARGDAKVGLLVQVVHGASKLDAAAFEAPPENVRQAAYLRGSASTAAGVLLLLDLDSFVTSSDVALEAL